MKNINKLCFVFVFIIALFSFNLDVMAQELTCIYENGIKLTQSLDGTLKAYHSIDNYGVVRWDEITKLNDKDVKFEFDSKLYTTSLDGCPSFMHTLSTSNALYFTDKKSALTTDYSLESQEDRVITHNYQELTCLYEKKGINNSHWFDIDKILLTQDSKGVIKVYKNNKDVGYFDYSSYWNMSYGGKYLFEGVNRDPVTGGLLSCPASKTTLNFSVGVKFFGNDAGEEKLIDESKGIVNFLDSSVTTGSVSEVDVGYGKTCNSISTNDKWLTKFDSVNYGGSCLYQYDTEWGCHLIEVNMSTTVVNVVDSFAGKKLGINNYYSKVGFENFSPQHIQNTAESVGCPPVLNVTFSEYSAYDEFIVDGNINYGSETGNLYGIVAVRGNNVFTGEALVAGSPELNFNIVSIFGNCGDLFGGNEAFVKALSTIITILKIAIPIVLFALGTLDFTKAIFSGSEDGMKKAQVKFIKRVLIAVCIFLIPTFLKLILTIANSVWGGISADLCGLL